MVVHSPLIMPGFDRGELRALVAEMGGLAEAAIADALAALGGRDLDGAAAVVARDRDLDALEREVENRVLRLLSARSGSENEAREALAVLRIASTIERIGDYAKNIARRVPLIEDARGMASLPILPATGRAAAEMVRSALDAFAARDPVAASKVAEQDRTVDDLYNSLFRALLTYMAEHPDSIGATTHLLFIAKNLERIGDHATTIAEMVYYAATGDRMGERTRGSSPLAPARGD
jgi:phosphate transport system protein